MSDAGEPRGVQSSAELEPGISDGVNGSVDDAYRRDHMIHQYLVGIRIPFPSLAVQMVVLGLEENTAVILRRSLIQA